MNITDAKFEGGWLMLKAVPRDVIRFLRDFKAGDYEVKRARKKRSLDANAFAWALINEIAGEMREKPVDIYRRAVLDIGGTTADLLADTDTVEAFIKAFVGDHIGRQVRTEPSPFPGKVVIHATYGSSDYDTKQMSQLIDNLLQDAHILGIETPEDERIRTLIEEWDNAQKNGGARHQ